jgi:hypothetical protein
MNLLLYNLGCLKKYKNDLNHGTRSLDRDLKAGIRE